MSRNQGHRNSGVWGTDMRRGHKRKKIRKSPGHIKNQSTETERTMISSRQQIWDVRAGVLWHFSASCALAKKLLGHFLSG